MPFALPFLTRGRALTVAVSGLGVAVFAGLGLPLPFLFGPLFACLLAALSGARLQSMGQLGIAFRTILGVAVGASLTPEIFGRLPQLAGSVALIPLYIAAIAAVGVPFFVRVCGFDRVTAYYAAMPGGLQDMVIFGAEAGGDVRALSLIQVTRVLILVTLAPILMAWAFEASLDGPLGEPFTAVPPQDLALMVAAALIGWKGGERIGLFGASILGPLIVTGALSLTGVITHRPPAEAIKAAQVFIGMTIGVYYVGITLAELRRDVLAGIGFMVLLSVLTVIWAEVVWLLGLAPQLEAFLAFAPGGQAEMTILAIVAGADLGFVIVHHLVRIVLVITCAPLAAKVFGVSRGGRPPS
jgi:membrane AbrB-like protein